MNHNKKPLRFLVVSLITVSLLCVCTFSFLALYMNQRSGETISRVGQIYMSGMSQQISMHFETTMNLRLSQVEALVATNAPGSKEPDQLMRDLFYGAQARGFEHLALYSTDGTFETLYGSDLTVTDPEPFLASLNNNEKKIAVGSDAEGNHLVLMGVSSTYPMSGGKTCTALVTALPVDYISDTLSLDDEDSLMYSHIIRRDGSFVIRGGSAYRDNYFERINAIYDELGGTGADQHVQELQDAMDAGEDYSTVLQIGKERRHLLCTKLSYSEWYLVVVMPYGSLNEEISQLSRQWSLTALGACALVLAALLLIFFWYIQLTRQQMRELERARQAAVSANKAKSEFLSNMSHDIRTPMNAIVGMTAIATANIDNQQQVQHCLKKITLSSKHLLNLINDVLDMSKIESGKMTLNIDQVSLREMMDGIVSIVQPQVRAKQQQFDIFIHDISSENVLCDSVRLNQVILNLLSNAVKFTPVKGSIHISLYQEPSDRGEDFVRTHLKVRDSGIGMSPEFQAKIFDSFTREDSRRVQQTEGTGLGMAITKFIVDAMGGTIDLRSEQGKGSEFHITLDLERSTLQEVDMVLPEWNMLVVDDDRELCESTVASLKSIGLHAEWTLDGESAIRMAEEHSRRHDAYHIILLDWKLPGMDGIQTARELRQRLETDIPILLISAYDWSDIEAEAKNAGINGFISKPLFKSTLFYGLRPFVDGNAVTADNLPPEEHEVEFTGKRILLAEDNELNWEIANELLTELGLKLDWAENGKICVEKFSASAPGYYDAILMDLRMPVMTGYEATRAIRALKDRPDASLPIIAMTADAFSEDIQRCLEAGMNAHISKPIDLREVSRLLEKYLHE